MKKIIGSILIIASLAEAADTGTGGSMYVGLDLGVAKVDRTFELSSGSYAYTSSNGEDKIKNGAIKIGFGKFTENRLEVSLQRYNEDLTSGSDTQTLFNSSDTMGIGVDYLITMPGISPVVMPFIKLGVNVSRAELGFNAVIQNSGEKRDTVYGLGATVGAGVTFQITDYLDVLGGFDYTHRQWEDMTDGPYTLETTDKIRKIYAGVNLRF